MYTMRFEPTSRYYERVYAAAVTGEAPKDRPERKALSAALDKLERIGQPLPFLDLATGKSREKIRGEVTLYESVSGGDVELENAEFDVLKHRTLEQCKGAHPSLVRETEALEAWLEAIVKDTAATARPQEEAGITGH